mgnify:CR=1 FL=1
MISIILPIYNVESYLRQCLDSLFSQFDASFMEVILVNDGSTDMSLDICKEYKRRYPEVIIINKENGGLSDARNAGLEAATGEYCYFLDSDDWLAPNAIKSLYDFAIEKECEVVQGGFYYAYDTHLLYDNRWINENIQPFVLSKVEAMKELLKQQYVKNFAWGKVYKTEIVKKHLFKKGAYFEDSFWQHLIIHEVNQYGVIPTPLYYYRQRSSGISGGFSLKNLDLLKGNEERLAFIEQEHPELTNLMAASFWKLAFQFQEIAKKHPDIEVKDAFSKFWNRINIQYKELFDKALRDDTLYRLNHQSAFLTKTYLLSKRVQDRFFGKSLKRIELS